MASSSEKQHYFEALSGHHKQLEMWAKNCRENFENRAALIGAEVARIEARDADAMRLYEDAIRSACANGFAHNQALAYELAARFYAAREFEEIAHLYLRKARYYYLRWGADGKVRQLEETYPHLQEEERAAVPTSTIAAPVDQLDLDTVIKVSQAVSGEFVLEKLLEIIMRTAIAQVGAERGVLILSTEAKPRLRAEATTSGGTLVVHLRDQTVTATELPATVLHHVLRTRESVILDDATTEPPSAADPYVRERRARSIHDLTPPEWHDSTAGALEELDTTGAAQAYEKEYLRKDGSRVPVLIGAAAFDQARDEGVTFVLDLTGLKRAEAAAREMQMELAHANRVATMGQLSASIAHEINQPIGAAITYADAGLRWLGANPPNLEEVRQAFDLILESGVRAGEVMDRIRALVRKAPPREASLEINEVILEVIALTSREMEKNGISTRTQLAESLPAIQGDRVQLQQVILNLLINAIEAMSGMSEGQREC